MLRNLRSSDVDQTQIDHQNLKPSLIKIGKTSLQLRCPSSSIVSCNLDAVSTYKSHACVYIHQALSCSMAYVYVFTCMYVYIYMCICIYNIYLSITCTIFALSNSNALRLPSPAAPPGLPAACSPPGRPQRSVENRAMNTRRSSTVRKASTDVRLPKEQTDCDCTEVRR